MTLSECGGHARAIGANVFALVHSGDGNSLCETVNNSFVLLGSNSNELSARVRVIGQLYLVSNTTDLGCFFNIFLITVTLFCGLLKLDYFVL